MYDTAWVSNSYGLLVDAGAVIEGSLMPQYTHNDIECWELAYGPNKGRHGYFEKQYHMDARTKIQLW